MEHIVLEVRTGTTRKWEQASVRLKKQAAKAVEEVLATAEKHHHTQNNDDLRFYDDIRIDDHLPSNKSKGTNKGCLETA